MVDTTYGVRGSHHQRLRLPSGSSLRGAFRAEDGFTLIELMVAMVILSLVFASFSYLISSALNDSAAITNDSALESEARSTLDQLTNELRDAYPLTSVMTSPFVTSGTMPASPNTATPLTFYAPAETYASGAPTAFNMEELSYRLNGTSLQQARATSTNSVTPTVAGWTMPGLSSYATLVTNVTGFSLSYVDSSGASTTSPASVAVVNVSLTIKDPAGQSFTLVDSAGLRVDQ